MNSIIKLNKGYLKFSIYFLNFIFLASLILYTILFYLEIKVNMLSNSIIIFSLTALFHKLLYWYLIKNNFNYSNLNKTYRHKNILLCLTFCIFTYLTPAYYIFKKDSMVMNDEIIFFTLLLILSLSLIGIFIERYLFFIKSEEKNLSYGDKK